MSRKFQRNVEDFTCEVCGSEVKGTGYTDHCPNCLCSKHVDINPGDRKSTCMGIMRPIAAEHNRKGFIILFECDKCNYKHKVSAAETDNKELLIELSAKGS